MQTINGVELRLSPATAYTVRNILEEWVMEHTPVDEYIDRTYEARSLGFKEFARLTVTDRLARVKAALEQLEDQA